MTKSQVRFVLGNAVVDDSLHAARWDYVYTLSVAGGDQIKTKLSIYFVEERLSYFVGDFIPSDEYEKYGKTILKRRRDQLADDELL